LSISFAITQMLLNYKSSKIYFVIMEYLTLSTASGVTDIMDLSQNVWRKTFSWKL